MLCHLRGPGRRLRLARFAAFGAALGIVPMALARDTHQQSQDWPCRQILVERISLAAVWSGPPVEGVTWTSDPAVAALVGELSARRTELKDAERRIDEFAKAQGDNKAKLVAVFAGLFETLNDERSQVIAGLLRFGARQRELAARIRAESGRAQRKDNMPAPSQEGEAADAETQQLQWDTRLFDERRQNLTFVCESPVLIEQRLFALARVIQRDLQ